VFLLETPYQIIDSEKFWIHWIGSLGLKRRIETSWQEFWTSQGALYNYSETLILTNLASKGHQLAVWCYDEI